MTCALCTVLFTYAYVNVLCYPELVEWNICRDRTYFIGTNKTSCSFFLIPTRRLNVGSDSFFVFWVKRLVPCPKYPKVAGIYGKKTSH